MLYHNYWKTCFSILQDIMKQLELDFYPKMSNYYETIAKTELETSCAISSGFADISELAANLSRGHNFRCYVKAYPSLAEHVQ